MNFDERGEWVHRIDAGAMESPIGDGYLAAVVVTRWRSRSDVPMDAFRDESLACGHRWQTAQVALDFAITRGRKPYATRRAD